MRAMYKSTATSSAQLLIGCVPRVRAGTKSSSQQLVREEKILASNDSNQVTVVLGDEFDDALRTRLMNVLKKLGGMQDGTKDWFVAGSQELENLDVVIDGSRLHIEAETYVGLSITGSPQLTEQVRRLVAE